MYIIIPHSRIWLMTTSVHVLRASLENVVMWTLMIVWGIHARMETGVRWDWTALINVDGLVGMTVMMLLWMQDLINGYHCTCMFGYTGDDCGTNIDDCQTNLCQNGATCNVSNMSGTQAVVWGSEEASLYTIIVLQYLITVCHFDALQLLNIISTYEWNSNTESS